MLPRQERAGGRHGHGGLRACWLKNLEGVCSFTHSLLLLVLLCWMVCAGFAATRRAWMVLLPGCRTVLRRCLWGLLPSGAYRLDWKVLQGSFTGAGQQWEREVG